MQARGEKGVYMLFVISKRNSRSEQNSDGTPKVIKNQIEELASYWINKIRMTRAPFKVARQVMFPVKWQFV